MKTTLVVVADLACLKAFKLEENHGTRTRRLELVEQFDNAEAHEKLGERVSDLSGRFPRATGSSSATGAMSDGERHNVGLELRKRLVRQLAGRLNVLAGDQAVERCLLAASREINHPLFDALDPQVRAKIQVNIAADLTKVERAEIMSHF